MRFPEKIKIDFKRINIILIFLTVVLFSYYIYQTVSISSGDVMLMNLKKEFLERKNKINDLISGLKNYENLNPIYAKENLKMSEIEKFDYIIIGPSEFALIEGNRTKNSQ